MMKRTRIFMKTHKSAATKIAKSVLTTVFLLCTILYSKAQLAPFQNMYFQNKYIYNPAMAGLDKGLNLNVAYRKQWSSFPGTPETGMITADLKATDKVGLGVNVVNDKAGLIKQTRAVATYAYHLPLNDQDSHLSFGVSLGINDSRVDQNAVNGDPTDMELNRYNELKAYLDGDFGVAYTSSRLYLSASMPNLKSTFANSSDQRIDVDKLLFIGIASYKIPVGDGGNFTLEPLAGLRVVKGYKDIVDVGANFSIDQYGLFFQSIYHSSNSLGFGAGLDQGTYAFNVSYNLETGQLKTYTHGAFELGLKLKLFGK